MIMAKEPSIKGFPHTISFNLQSNKLGGKHCYPYFIEKETEAESATLYGDTANKLVRQVCPAPGAGR